MTKPDPLNISADIFIETHGDRWVAVLRLHPKNGGNGIEIWRKEGMKSCRHAETAMEAAYQRFQRADGKRAREALGDEH